MAELKVGGTSLQVKATPLSLLFYKQEFHADMMSDFIGIFVGFIGMMPGAKGMALEDLKDFEVDVTALTPESLADMQLDGLKVLQLVWAMAKTAAYGEGPFPGFEPWLASLADASLFDNEFLAAALEVAADGLFRTAGNPGVVPGR